MLIDIILEQIQFLFRDFADVVTVLVFTFLGELYALIAPLIGQAPPA